MEQKKNIRQILASNLKRIRQEKNLTIEELAKITELSQSFISKVENCQKKRIYLSHIFIFSKALSINANDLLEED